MLRGRCSRNYPHEPKAQANFTPEMARGSSPLRWRLKSAAVLVFLFIFVVQASQGFSVLTHEAIIDSEWDPVIKPLLLQRFPNATPDNGRVDAGLRSNQTAASVEVIILPAFCAVVVLV